MSEKVHMIKNPIFQEAFANFISGYDRINDKYIKILLKIFDSIDIDKIRDKYPLDSLEQIRKFEFVIRRLYRSIYNDILTYPGTNSYMDKSDLEYYFEGDNSEFKRIANMIDDFIYSPENQDN